VAASLIHSQLEEAFWADVNATGRKPAGGYTFTFQGCEVRRDSVPLRSNSRKSIVAWRSAFYVTSPSGVPYMVHDERGAPNRGNDPERNWGLGRD
jgi:hypothetical protein